MRPIRSVPTPLALAVTLALVAGCSPAAEVDVVLVSTGTIVESFDEPGRTRLSRTHRVSMSVDARVGRVELEPGDAIEKDAPIVLVDLKPFELVVAEAESAITELDAQLDVNANEELEDTARDYVQQTIAASEEALQAAQQQVEAAKARSERAAREAERSREIFESGGLTSPSQVEDAALLADTSRIDWLQQQFIERSFATLITAMKLGPRLIDNWLARRRLESHVIKAQRAQASVRLERARYRLALAKGLVSPVAGVVLRKLDPGESALPAGAPLVEIGDLADLEVVADVLSSDALSLAVGGPVTLDPGGGRPTIAGRVKRIEPAGFTKLSSLGVEQQRVNVIVGFDAVPDGIGVGYRLAARFVTGTKDDAVIVPRFSVLQSATGVHHVFVVEKGTLKRRDVTLGLRSDLQLEVASGLAAGDRIVRAPDADLVDGGRVSVRDPAE